MRCLTTGCVAEVVMEDTLIDQLKSGKTATFIVFQTPEEGIGIPVSLNGFGARVRGPAVSDAHDAGRPRWLRPAHR